MSNNLGEERLLTIMKTLERTSESEQMILLEYLIVGACDFDLYYHVLTTLSEEGKALLVNSIFDATDNIRKEVRNILKKELEGAE